MSDPYDDAAFTAWNSTQDALNPSAYSGWVGALKYERNRSKLNNQPGERAMAHQAHYVVVITGHGPSGNADECDIEARISELHATLAKDGHELHHSIRGFGTVVHSTVFDHEKKTEHEERF